MRSGFIVAIIGLVLVIVGIIALAFLAGQAMELSDTIEIPANGTKDYKISCYEGGSYMVTVSSDTGNFSYVLTTPSGIEVAKGTNVSSDSFNFTAVESGEYNLRITNQESTDITVMVFVFGEGDIMSLMYSALGVTALCCIGALMLIIGLIVGLLQTKKEEPVYHPPPSPPAPPTSEEGDSYRRV